MRIKTLTAVFFFSTLWFCIVVAIGKHTHNPYMRDSLPGLYIGGVAIYAILLTIVKIWRSHQ